MIKKDKQKTSTCRLVLKRTSVKFDAGFTMLYASLIGSLVLAIGLAILNVTVKQITLASAGRESIKAFYAADIGVECAWYLNNKEVNTPCPDGRFGTEAAPEFCTQGTPSECLNYDVLSGVGYSVIISDPDYIKGKFRIEDNTDNICVDIEVEKGLLDQSTPNERQGTKFTATGYNTSCDSTAPNRFARTLISESNPPPNN